MQPMPSDIDEPAGRWSVSDGGHGVSVDQRS
jgi:hypothetical protein